MKYSTFILAFILAGCMHTTEIVTTKSWEGHFKDIESFKKTTDDIQLDKDESIWVLSDRTLNRVLKNIERN